MLTDTFTHTQIRKPSSLCLCLFSLSVILTIYTFLKSCPCLHCALLVCWPHLQPVYMSIVFFSVKRIQRLWQEWYWRIWILITLQTFLTFLIYHTLCSNSKRLTYLIQSTSRQKHTFISVWMTDTVLSPLNHTSIS